ncbi:MAG TPA: hypothetical protein VMI94_26160 [Bryobacteraceae bacterium]|nr:hypothetical protein [Bryobacteraceae bacterium]
MRVCGLVLTLSAAAFGQPVQPPATIPAGVPLRVALESKVPIKHTGAPIRGRLAEPVYVYDREVLPAGSIVEGHVAEIGGVPWRRRLTGILSGNFTPPRKVRAQFDAVVRSDGVRLPLETSPARGTPHTRRVAKPRKRPAAGPRLADRMDPVALAFREPGRMSRLKSYLCNMLPYRRQSWPAGTLFDSMLTRPVTATAKPIEPPANSGAQAVRARLLTPITSRTARRGTPVEAVVTRPLFSDKHDLLIPEGSRLIGDVLTAQHARWLHRNGKLLFVFREIRPASGPAEAVKGYVEGLEADFDEHLRLDAEGAASVTNSKTRFIFPAIAAAVAGLSFHQDFNAQGVPDADSAGRAESGAVGLGLVGAAVAQLSRPLASGIAIAGAAFSLYTNVLGRGAEVDLPVNTPVEVSLKPER